MEKLFLSFFAFLLAVAPLPAQANKQIVMVFGNGYPPFYSIAGTNDDGSVLVEGAFADFLAAFEQKYPDYSIHKIPLPRLRLDRWVREGKADAFSLNSPLFTPKKDKEAVEFSLPIWTSSDHLVVRTSSSMERADLEELKGKRIGLIYGNGYGAIDVLIESGEIEEQRVYKANQLPEILLAGRVDGYIGNRHVEPFIWKRNGHDPALYKILMPPLYEFGLSVVIRREHKQFLNDLNAFIEKSRSNGLLDAINRKYFQPHTKN